MKLKYISFLTPNTVKSTFYTYLISDFQNQLVQSVQVADAAKVLKLFFGCSRLARNNISNRQNLKMILTFDIIKICTIIKKNVGFSQQ